MKKLACNHQREAGYNLVGITLFMTVLGIMIVGGLGLKQKYDWAKRQEVTVENKKIIKDALRKYFAENGVLPCPASLTQPPSSPDFGRPSDCSVPVVNNSGIFSDNGRGGREIRYGAIPVRTLNLPQSVMVDGWGHRYVYAVTQYYTIGTPDPGFDYGAIRVVDENDDTMTKTRGNVIFAVITPASDERGAYTMDGILIADCTGASTNCVDETSPKDGRLTVNVYKQHNMATDSTDDTFTSELIYAASAKTYEWRATSWDGDCTCDNPFQTRTAACYERGTNDVVDDDFCAMSLRPELRRDCADFCWNVVFPPCPGGCGGDVTITGQLFCQENWDENVPFSLCSPKPQPPTQKTCSRPSCPTSSGAWVDRDGDGRGDTWGSASECGQTGGCSATPGETITSGLDDTPFTPEDYGCAVDCQ